MIDLLILAVVDLAVVYFTLQICGLSLADLDILPKAPLVAFLVVRALWTAVLRRRAPAT